MTQRIPAPASDSANAQDDDRDRQRTGLFGGTFNPIHLGHLRAAEEVCDALELSQILFIPSALPPHKRDAEEDPIASAKQRLEWVEAATAANPAFNVDRIEIDREGPSFLVDTLTAIRAREDGRPPVFIVGSDAFAEMGDWRAPEKLFALADFAVMTRPPGRLQRLEEHIPEIVRAAYTFSEDGRSARHREADTRIDLIAITALDISSSQIRKTCRAGHSIRFLVPESIRAAIEDSGAYTSPSPSLASA